MVVQVGGLASHLVDLDVVVPTSIAVATRTVSERRKNSHNNADKHSPLRLLLLLDALLLLLFLLALLLLDRRLDVLLRVVLDHGRLALGAAARLLLDGRLLLGRRRLGSRRPRARRAPVEGGRRARALLAAELLEMLSVVGEEES